MHHLDNIFKSRDITLPTNVQLVNAMVFKVVMYGCESWTVNKAEHQRIGAFFFFFFLLPWLYYFFFLLFFFNFILFLNFT